MSDREALDKIIEEESGTKFGLRYFWEDGWADVTEAGALAQWSLLDDVTKAAADLLNKKKSFVYDAVVESFSDQDSVPDIEAVSITTMTTITTIKKE